MDVRRATLEQHPSEFCRAQTTWGPVTESQVSSPLRPVQWRDGQGEMWSTDPSSVECVAQRWGQAESNAIRNSAWILRVLER